MFSFVKTDRAKGWAIIRAAAAVVCLAPTVLSANIYFVDGDFQGTSARGDSWLSAFSSLQEAIDTAAKNGGGEIWVKAGVYTPTGRDQISTFKLKEGVQLYGGFRGIENQRIQRNPKAYRTILSGDIGDIGNDSDNCYHVLTGASETLLDGFIVSHGNANGVNDNAVGGGMLIPTGTQNLRLSDCTFENNTAISQGGAIFIQDGSMSVSNCTFYGNAAETGGGALATRGNVQLTLSGTFFSANFSRSTGGAILLNDDATVEIHSSNFLYNSSHANGGALAASAKTAARIELHIADSNFTENSALQNAGALFFGGEITPIVENCSFTKNSAKEAGGIGLVDGTVALVSQCTFTRNKGGKGIENQGSDDSAAFVESRDELERIKPAILDEPPVEQGEKPLQDVFVYSAADGTKLKLRSIVSSSEFTVLVLADLTHPDFIRNYRNIESFAYDYDPEKLHSFYIYRYLIHPENHGFLQPFSLRERAAQTKLANQYLSTRVPWLYDIMDNQTAKALAPEAEHDVFIYSAAGEELFAGSIDEPQSIREKLDELIGTPESRRSPGQLPGPRIKPIELPSPSLVQRIHFNPETEPFTPLQVSPMDSRVPFYVKLRAEADDQLLQTGTGRIYLGFHADPLYQAAWNNREAPLKYQVVAPQGTVAPSIQRAPEINQKQYDSEPREFMLNARGVDTVKPLMLQVEYSVFLPSLERTVAVTQQYFIYLDRDLFGGKAYRRQIAYADPAPWKPNNIPTDIPYALRQYDADSDGKLTRDEAKGTLWSKFPDIDTNRDGYLNSEEYSTYLRNR